MKGRERAVEAEIDRMVKKERAAARAVGRRWYEANAESDATSAWKAWEALSPADKRRHARAEKAFVDKLYDAGYLIMTKASADSIEKASGKKSTVVTAEDLNTYVDEGAAFAELLKVRDVLDKHRPGEGAIAERVEGLFDWFSSLMAETDEIHRESEQELAKLKAELKRFGADDSKAPSEVVSALLAERTNLMREVVRRESDLATQQDRAAVLESVILKALRGGRS